MSEEERKPTLWQVIQSVLAAMIGIQKDKNRVRDFTQGNPWAYVIVGIVFVIVFVLVLYFVVQGIISASSLRGT